MSPRSRLLPAALAVAAATAAAVQAVHAAPAAPGTWLQPAHDAAQTWTNPQETTLSAGNVKRLRLVVTQQVGRFWVGPTTQSGGQLIDCNDATGLSAIDMASGTPSWARFDFGGNGANCQAAALDAATAYVSALGWAQQPWTVTLTAVDRGTGQTRWQVQGPSDRPGNASWLGFNQPVLDKGAIYVTHQRSLVAAYDAATGAPRWQVETGLLNNTAAVAGGLVFTTTWGESPDGVNALFAHRAADGTLAWRQPLDTSHAEYPAVVAGGRVVAGSDSGWVRAFQATSGAPLWQVQLAGYVSAPPVLNADAAYVNAGLHAVVALDAATGATRWQATLPGTFKVASNLVLANGVLYFTAMDGGGAHHLTALEAATGRRLAQPPDQVDGSYANVAVAGGRVFVSDTYGRVRVFALP